MTIPNIYRKNQSRLNQSYDFNDIASGAGYVVFYGWVSQDDSAKDYHLTTDSTMKSDVIETDLGIGAGGIIGDFDFDSSELNLPRTIKGDVLVNVPIQIDDGAGAESAYVKVFVRKWDGTTETEIASTQGATETAIGERTFGILVNVPETNFKKKETIRITIQVTASNNASTHIGHDPANRDGTNITENTQIKIAIPFKVNI